ncbi:hypothetical protein J3Q64DRAFT_1706939 [Phycomyces blakesleeanus]|uniref:Transcription factor domain-containing protein n=2 Tax=Phycomyces blakesleeanus TaxID=4837 RepID=A0A162USR4_PHYB8|nr:hypothetical protein PHYBLDRAFT_164559 [Phycomyces blakesleeanus NRRL 1555(-)]OAD77663.1 hypothetical protein PHYBLDRAFT_164559 [Phycomyces blakesleeanus NRRL 1555(-)]|eukprot:XP_018295703.1 hypothetical protein PHYBLDRAFT_164559 [Phycomyces blakesleeanus NRRL 1555(-)]
MPSYHSCPDIQSTSDGSQPQLPVGWLITGRRCSAMELETNIRTLGELYDTLTALRNQLPSPIAIDLENSHLSPFFDNVPHKPDITLTRNSSSSLSSLPQCSGLETPMYEKLAKYPMTLDNYPSTIYEPLVRLHLNCTSYPRTDKDAFIEAHRTGSFSHPALTCAMYAHSAIHSLYCHPEAIIEAYRPLLFQMGKDCYDMSRDLLEFDLVTPETIETLVLMHLYLVRVGDPDSVGEASNLLCLAIRQLTMLPKRGRQSDKINRLWAWVAKHDLAQATRSHTSPLLPVDHPTQSLSYCFPNYQDIPYSVLAIEKAGLSLLAESFQQSSVAVSLNRLEEWRTNGLLALGELNLMSGYSSITNLTHLEELYFIGRLHIHETEMMEAFGSDESWCHSTWDDYFNEKRQEREHKIERALEASMQAAFGLVGVTKKYFDANYLCRFPETIETLSAACTMLYFGSKMSIQPVAKQSEAALIYLVNSFESTPSLMHNIYVRQFVEKWRTLS